MWWMWLVREGVMCEPGRDDCDEQLDEPSAEDIARQYVAEHGRVESDGQDTELAH